MEAFKKLRALAVAVGGNALAVVVSVVFVGFWVLIAIGLWRLAWKFAFGGGL